MTDLEDRLRHDLTQLSQRAQPGFIRPLRAPPARSRPRASRWLAPAAAAVAVIGVITSVSLVSGPARPPAAGEGRVPPYYVVVQESFAGSTGGFLDKAVIRDSATGRALASIPLPGDAPVTISGAADGRTFVITDGHQKNLYRMRLAADGRSARLSRLPIGVPNPPFDNLTLSPDGSTVAFQFQRCTFSGGSIVCRYSAIRLVSLRTGATRTWSTRAPAQLNSIWMSWDGNDHLLFSWASTGAPPRRSGYWLLDVSGPGGNLLAARKLPLPPLPVIPGLPDPYESAFITPDGSAVIMSTFSATGPIDSPTVVSTVVERSARTGRLLRVLLRETSVGYGPGAPGVPRAGCWIYSLGPTGVHALVGCFSPGDTFGRLDNGQFTPLPGYPVPDPVALTDVAW